MEKISLAGDLGSGKSTLSRLLIDALGAEYYSTGSIVRGIAESMNMTVGELNTYMESHPEIDNMIDDGLVKLSDDERMLIIDSRMAWHFAENSFKVYLYVPIEVSVKRILNDQSRGNVEEYKDAADAEAKITARMQSESLRYKEFYGVDNHDLNNYDLILCTSSISPEEAADIIWREFNTYLADPSAYPKPNKLFMEN